jgi:hypothetical protein
MEGVRGSNSLLQARALTRVLVDTGALADHETVLEEFRQQHYRKYPRLHRIRLNRLWTGLHLGIAVYGIVLIIITWRLY